MAPRARRGENAEPDALYQLGVRGRKTGVFLPDGGERDEFGMQPLDRIFSSPQKEPASTGIQDDSGSEDMDIASSAGPGPRTLLKEQRHIPFPIPRSRSPAKTHLMSPARRNPHIGRSSSPTRDSPADGDARDPPLNRRLNYAAKSNGPKPGARAKANGVSRVPAAIETLTDDGEDLDVDDMLNESLQMVEGMDDVDLPNDDLPEVIDEPPATSAPPAKKGRGRPKKLSMQSTHSEVDREASQLESESASKKAPALDNDSDEEPVKKPRGRPAKNARPQPQREPTQPVSRKRRSIRNSSGGEEEQEQDEVQAQEQEPEAEPVRPAKKQRTQDAGTKKGPEVAKPVPVAKKTEEAAPKSRGRPKKAAKVTQEAGTTEAEAGEASFMALQRGPPMPKSRGLVSVRRDPHSVTQTRSGRHSYQPLHWWRGEEVVRRAEAHGDLFYRDQFVVSSVEEVVRVPEEEAPSKRSSRPRGRSAKPKTKSKQRRALLEDEEEPEEWELNEGTVTGEVVIWEPEHELHPPADDEPVHITEDQIAISADAVQTTQIRDGTFRFAKTLTMPFMGSGIVDLPPGAEKRPKNSRKMHMVFFVHYGKVVVTVNEAQFRISAGGMWFVPRGNYYSISNDYDHPCRIFFSQACEVSAQASENGGQEATQSMLSMA